MVFLSQFPDVIRISRISMTEVSFFAELEPATQWLVACFSMTCDLNGFTHISSLGSLQSTFLSDFHLCFYDFFVILCLVEAAQPCME